MPLTSSGRCASSCRIMRGCAHAGSCVSASSSMITSAAAGRCPHTRGIDLGRDPVGAPLRSDYRHAFVYSDCWVDDARLVILNAVDAAERGAIIRTRARCSEAIRQDGRWLLQVSLNGENTGGAETARVETVSARALINAAGPWVGSVESSVMGQKHQDARAPRQGQPHHHPRASSTTTLPISSRIGTDASSSPSPMRTGDTR